MSNLTPKRDTSTRAFLNAEMAEVKPGKTYKMHIDKKQINGILDDRVEEIKQMVYKFVNTEKGQHFIYPSFGLKKRDVFHRPKTYAYNVLKDRIKKGLELDDRVKLVDSFFYDRENSKGHSLAMGFTVRSIYGPIEFKEVIGLE